MHGIVFDLIYWLGQQALAGLPPSARDGLCRLESHVPWPQRQVLAAQVAGRLGCSAGEARQVLARARANEHCARIDAVRWSRGPGRNQVQIRLESIEHLHQAAALQRGVIVAMPHTSPISVAVWPAQRAVAELGYRVHAFAWEAPPARALATNALGYTDPAWGQAQRAFAMLRALRSGDLVTTAVDYPVASGPVAAIDRRWIVRRFLGRRLGFSPGISALARRAQSPIVPAISLRTGPSAYSLRFLPSLCPPRSGEEEPAVMDQLLDLLETEVRAQPDQYSPWFYTFPALAVDRDAHCCTDIAGGG